MVVNDCGELLDFRLTPGYEHDMKPGKDLTKRLFGKVFGDNGYLSQLLCDDFWEQGIQLITSVRRNMKPQLMDLATKLLLRQLDEWCNCIFSSPEETISCG